MRTMILSFSSEWYPQLIDGRKIFEHRKRFCSEPVKAYIYLGLPYRKLVAVAELGERISLSDWLEDFKSDQNAIIRIQDFMKRNKYAMPILSIQEIEPIDIRYIENNFERFRAPISYRFLDEQEEILHYVEKQTKYDGKKITHNFDGLTSKDVCLF